MGSQYAIIGTGPAGVVAAETLRKTDPDSDITLIGDEQESPYSRMAIPYHLIGKIKEEGTHLRHGKKHYENLGISVKTGRVTAVDSGKKSITLDDGGNLSYDRLLIATGSRPIKLPIPGVDDQDVYNCWTLEDSRSIIARAKPKSKVVLMGAGFIGCIILEALIRRGVQLDVVERGDRMVPRMMDQTAGNMIRRWCENKGVRSHMSTTAVGIERSGKTLSVRLDNGEALPADLVISAAGVVPCVDFLEGSGIKLGESGGILVDNHLCSNQPDIYAAGDVCEGIDFSTGGHSVHAIQPTAVDHARLAAMNMAGRAVRHQGSVVMNVLDTVGLISSSFGLWEGTEGGDNSCLTDENRFRYLNLEFKDDRLVGAQAVGWTEHIGVLRGLIQTRIRLGKWKEHLKKDPTRIMEAYLGSTQPVGYNGRLITAA